MLGRVVLGAAGRVRVGGTGTGSRTGKSGNRALLGVAAAAAALAAAATTTEPTQSQSKTRLGPAPPTLVALTKLSDEVLAKDLQLSSDVASDGNKWNVALKADGVTVWWSDVRDRKGARRWRIEADGLWGTTLEIAHELHDFTKRCRSAENPKPWDSTFSWGMLLGMYDAPGKPGKEDEYYEVLHYATAPAAGGMVSSRDFVQGVWVQRLPHTGIRLSETSMDTFASKLELPADLATGVPRLAEINKGVAGCLRGTLYSGCGVELVPLDPASDPAKPRMHKYIAVSNNDTGGWIPQALLNQVMADTMKGAVVNLKAYLESRRAAGTSLK